MVDTRSATLPLLALPAGVVVPGMVVQLGLDDEAARAAVAAARAGDGRLVLVPQVAGRYAAIGTTASVEQVERGRGRTRVALLRGEARVHIGAGEVDTGGALRVAVTPAAEVNPDTERAHDLARTYREVLDELLRARGAGRIRDLLAGITEPGALADTAIYSPDLALEVKVEILETLDVEARLELVVEHARAALAEAGVDEAIRNRVTDSLGRTQREHLLRQQLAAIRAELGEEDEATEGYRERLATADLPAHVRAAASKEVDRLERMGESNPEAGWVRTWLDTVLDLPWDVRDDERDDLDAARAQLDADHRGLDEVKSRIVEHLAVRALRQRRAAEDAAADGDAAGPDAARPATARRRGDGAILALVGPPGVGKTSLGESIAAALGRRFARIALGGVRDEAELRGHRRTYVGAQPGRLVRALREAGSMNPVVVLDEVDKLAADWRGDPTAALLEILDPAQNHTFRDHYLEVELDLSDVVFVATANVLETIPGPLLDRLEVIRLDGYSADEKAAIARTHLLPRLTEAAAVRPGELDLTDAALEAIVDGWTREAGVRGLERQLGKVVRKVAARLVTEADLDRVVVDADDLRDLLGRPPFDHEVADRTGVPGVATGLAVTGAGGDVLFVEATAMDGEPGLTITGQLGDVMRESAQIALSYVRANTASLGLDPAALDGRRVHLHVPAGAVPKDGPSAGITLVTALTSLATGRPVRTGMGMTGEVTLSGRVLPIGGVKQKVLAAHRAGLTDVILPVRNAAELDEVPATVREGMTFHPVDDVRDVLAIALAEAPAAAAA